MPKFQYIIKSKDGENHEGVVEATDRFDVYRQVRKPGTTVVSVKESGKGGLGKYFNFSYISSKIGSVRTSEKIIFARNMAAMLDAGLTISRALGVMEKQAKNPVLKRILTAISDDIKKGSTFHESLQKYDNVFSPLFISMVGAGEESGSLAESLRTVGEQMHHSYQLQKKIRGALIYPAIIIVAMVVIGILMLIFVVPTLTSTFEELDAELPASTQFVILISDFLTNNTLLALGIGVSIIVLFIFWMRTTSGRRIMEFIFMRIPVIGGLIRETNAARTARTLSSLLLSGVEVVAALEITKDVVQNTYFRQVIQEAIEEIQKGSPISKVFVENDKLYPILFSEIITVGEETGKLSEMLGEIALFYEEEVSQKTKDMSTIIEPFLMLIIGGAVGFFAVSMIMPIYSISNSI